MQGQQRFQAVMSKLPVLPPAPPSWFSKHSSLLHSFLGCQRKPQFNLGVA